jgi:hypothetical protein
MAARPILEDRFVVGVDVQRYSGRNARRQLGIQAELSRLLNDAAESAGLDRSRWERQPGGDGELAVLPHQVDLVAVVRRFVDELALALADHNDDYAPERQIRLRVAMHMDPLSTGELGYAGPALIVLNRLLDSQPVRDALVTNPDAGLALILSESVYTKAVTAELGGLRPSQFTPVAVNLPTKNFHQNAYIHIPHIP